MALSSCLALALTSCSRQSMEAYLKDTPVKKKAPDLFVKKKKAPVVLPVLLEEDEPEEAVCYDFSVKRGAKFSRRVTYEVPDDRTIALLDVAMKDLKNYFLVASHLRKSGQQEDLRILADFARHYLATRIDPLLEVERDNDNVDIVKLVSFIQYTKAILFYEIEDVLLACETLNILGIEPEQGEEKELDFTFSEFDEKELNRAVEDLKYACDADWQ